MAQTADFHVVYNDAESRILPMNEDSFHFLTDEMELSLEPNGEALLPSSDLERFLQRTEHAHMWSIVV